MSFGKKPLGKAIWGTTTYRVLLETSSQAFTEDMTGTLTLYERRWVSQRADFESRSEMINALREMWESSLRQGIIQDARFARWLEEYLNEIGIAVEYEDVLKAVKGEKSDVEKSHLSPDELVEVLGNEKEMKDEELKEISESFDGIVTTGVSVGFNREIAIEETEEILSTLVEKYKTKARLTTSTIVKFKDLQGEERTIQSEAPIISSPTIGAMVLTRDFVNSFGSEIDYLEMEIVIPYEYEIHNFIVDGSLSRIAEIETPDGVLVKWKCEKLKPGQKVGLTYHLLPRITRTIIIQTPKMAQIFRVYEKIEKNNGLFVSETKISNPTSETISSVAVLDQIPRFLSISHSSPPINPPLATTNVTEDNFEVNWLFQNLAPDGSLEIQYELQERPYVVRDIYLVKTPESVPILEGLKITKPLKRQSGYGVIFGCRGLRPINEPITIIDELPKHMSVSIIDMTSGDMSVTEERGRILVKWELERLEKDKEEFAYLRYKSEETYENTSLNIMIKENEPERILDSETNRKVDSIVLPHKFIEEVDTQF